MSNPQSDDIGDVPAGQAGLMNGMELGEEKTELDKIFLQMLDPKNLHHFTELNNGEITAFSTLGRLSNMLVKKYGIKTLEEWLIDNMKLRVSKARKGRLELVKITSRTGAGIENPNGPQRNAWGFFRN